MIRRIFATVLCASLAGVGVQQPAHAQMPEILQTAQHTVDSLNPVALGLRALVDYAVEKGDQALEARLRQLEAIINGAMFALQTTINYGLDKFDATVDAQTRKLNSAAQQLLQSFGFLANATLEQAQTYVREDLDKLQSTFGNTVAQIDFLNTTPVLNVPRGGFAIIRGPGNKTYMYMTGAGLRKLGVLPEVTLLRGGTVIAKIPVESGSMPLLKIGLPTSAIASGGNYVLSFKFCVGSTLGFKSYTQQDYPLLVCKVPRFSITTKLWVEGQRWDTRIRRLNEGNLEDGKIYGVQCPAGNNQRAGSMTITARPAQGWELYDPGWGRLINCVRNSANGYTDLGYSGGNACSIYADGRKGDAHLNVEVQVAERRRQTAAECATPFVDTRELHGTVSSSFEFSRVQLNGSCDSGLVLKALFRSSEGDALPALTGSLAGGQVRVNVGDGVVNMSTAPHCREQVYGKVVVASRR